jgi:hypothetical protein
VLLPLAALVERGSGLWNSNLPTAYAMTFHGDKRCKAFTEIIVAEGGHPARNP